MDLLSKHTLILTTKSSQKEGIKILCIFYLYFDTQQSLQLLLSASGGAIEKV
jgi:hypothetical protein